jgi:hypothetical protein
VELDHNRLLKVRTNFKNKIFLRVMVFKLRKKEYSWRYIKEYKIALSDGLSLRFVVFKVSIVFKKLISLTVVLSVAASFKKYVLSTCVTFNKMITQICLFELLSKEHNDSVLCRCFYFQGFNISHSVSVNLKYRNRS